MMNVQRLLFVFTLLSMVLAQCVVAQDPSSTVSGVASPNTVAAPYSERTPRYLVRPGDTLTVTFPYLTEMNQTVTVSPDGFVTLREVGDRYVTGLSLPELRQKLVESYSAVLLSPVIEIELKEFEKPFFVANGELTRPGKYDLTGELTLSQAIAVAGGFKDSAKHSEVLLFRRVAGGWMPVKKINVKQILSAQSLVEDPILHPGDTLFVPKNRLSKIRPFVPVPGLAFAYNPAY